MARRIPDDQLRASILPKGENHSQYFVLHSHGIEILRCWDWTYGIMETTLEDDVLYVGIVEYLKKLGLVFESEAMALTYGRQKGLVNPAENLPTID